MKTWIAGAVAALSLAGAAQAQDEVPLQLKWVTQAQFAGYYVAKDKGFYEEEAPTSSRRGWPRALPRANAACRW